MNHILRFTAEKTPALLERVLRTTRVRGFQITGLNVEEDREANRYRVCVRVISARPLRILETRLAATPGISNLNVLQALGNETNPVAVRPAGALG